MNRLVVVAVVVLAGLTSAAATTRATPVPAGSLRSYLHAVEPIRLGVNRLLEDADPILDAYRTHRSTPDQAAADMDTLERHFAESTVRINALTPSNATLARIH